MLSAPAVKEGTLHALQVTSHLLHINVAPNYMDTSKVFASQFVARRVGERFCKGNMQVNSSPCSKGVLPEITLILSSHTPFWTSHMHPLQHLLSSMQAFIIATASMKVFNDMIPSLEAFVTAMAGMEEYNEVRGNMFVPLAHRIMQAGGTFDVRDLETGAYTTPHLISLQTFAKICCLTILLAEGNLQCMFIAAIRFAMAHMF